MENLLELYAQKSGTEAKFRTQHQDTDLSAALVGFAGDPTQQQQQKNPICGQLTFSTEGLTCMAAFGLVLLLATF